jgi:hypothetical protein
LLLEEALEVVFVLNEVIFAILLIAVVVVAVVVVAEEVVV